MSGTRTARRPALSTRTPWNSSSGSCPSPRDLEWLAAFKLAQAYLHSLGITAWQDAIVTPDNLAVYRRAAETGLLTARVEAALWWERTKGAEQVDELVERAAAGSARRLRAHSVKIALDGVLETFTGAMIDPYLDRDGGPRPTGGSIPSRPSPYGSTSPDSTPRGCRSTSTRSVIGPSGSLSMRSRLPVAPTA